MLHRRVYIHTTWEGDRQKFFSPEVRCARARPPPSPAPRRPTAPCSVGWVRLARGRRAQPPSSRSSQGYIIRLAQSVRAAFAVLTGVGRRHVLIHPIIPPAWRARYHRSGREPVRLATTETIEDETIVEQSFRGCSLGESRDAAPIPRHFHPRLTKPSFSRRRDELIASLPNSSSVFFFPFFFKLKDE